MYIVFFDYYFFDYMGLIVLKMKDGRVVFMLLWLGCIVVGIIDFVVFFIMCFEFYEEEI